MEETLLDLETWTFPKYNITVWTSSAHYTYDEVEYSFIGFGTLVVTHKDGSQTIFAHGVWREIDAEPIRDISEQI